MFSLCLCVSLIDFQVEIVIVKIKNNIWCEDGVFEFFDKLLFNVEGVVGGVGCFFDVFFGSVQFDVGCDFFYGV